MGDAGRTAVAAGLALACASPVLAFPVRQALPGGATSTLEVDPALLPAFGLPAAPMRAASEPPLYWSALPAHAAYDPPAELRLAVPLVRPAKRKPGDQALGVIGVKDGRSYGETGRWYLYAGAGRQTVGLNLLNAPEGGLRRDGLSLDQLGRDKSRAEAGLAWRRGDVQTSLGYVHDRMKSRLFGVGSRSDDRVGLSVNWRPR